MPSTSEFVRHEEDAAARVGAGPDGLRERCNRCARHLGDASVPLTRYHRGSSQPRLTGEPQVERSFGAYQLGEPLGTLPFGELVEASHTARSEPLALLLLDDRLSGDHRFRGLVRLEMARAGGLRQPGIARTVEISEQSGSLAVVYERPVGACRWQRS